MTVWAVSTSMPLICAQSIPGNPIQLRAQIELRSVAAALFVFGLGPDRLRLQIHFGSERFQMFAQLKIAINDLALKDPIELYLLAEYEQQFLAPVPSKLFATSSGVACMPTLGFKERTTQRLRQSLKY
jgi:hypothetical protein